MRKFHICLPFFSTERWRNTLESEIYQESLIGSPLCYRMGQFKQQQDRSAFHPFRVWYFHDSRNLNYAILMPGDLRHQYGISGGESQTSVFAFSM